MKVRVKLNLSVGVLIAIFLVAAGMTIRAIGVNAEQTRAYSRVRKLSQLTADIRCDLYRRLLSADQGNDAEPAPGRSDWATYTTTDIDIQIRLASTEQERGLWHRLRRHVGTLAVAMAGGSTLDLDNPDVRQAEIELRRLRNFFDAAEAELAATVSESSLSAEKTMGIACLLTVFLFLTYLILVRDWLVRPLHLLKCAADAIGQGRLDHRVPLHGHDELTQVARHIDAMAARLARHQSELLEERELSAIGELCANVVHGLKNPLAAIRAAAQLAQRRATRPEELLPIIEALISEADRMDERISRLFQLSRPMELRRECVSFEEFVHAIQCETRSLGRKTGVVLSVEDETDGAILCVDRELAVSALTEIVTNAIHHSADGGEVVLRGSILAANNGSDARLEIEVIDQGSGMSPSTLAKAFDLFFTSRRSGSGMGLTMARRIIQRHGGGIKLESEPDHGTTALITLPGLCPHEEGDVLPDRCAALLALRTPVPGHSSPQRAMSPRSVYSR